MLVQRGFMTSPRLHSLSVAEQGFELRELDSRTLLSSGFLSYVSTIHMHYLLSVAQLPCEDRIFF